jgi:hypothetical protein
MEHPREVALMVVVMAHMDTDNMVVGTDNTLTLVVDVVDVAEVVAMDHMVLKVSVVPVVVNTGKNARKRKFL